MSDPAHAPLGFEFTETMHGFTAYGGHDYTQAEALGRKENDTLRFTVTIVIEDLAAFVRDREHRAKLAGTVEAARFGGRLPIIEGSFNLFALDGRGHKQMRYAMRFGAADGHHYLLEGFKDVHNDRVIDFWTDTTKLFVTVRSDDVPDGPVATGVLRIGPADLVPQVLSMRTRGATTALQQIEGLARFGLFFTQQMMSEYASIDQLLTLLRRPARTTGRP